MSDVKQEAAPLKAPQATTTKTTTPDFDQYINVVLTRENYEVVKDAVTKNPAKLEKIMKYVNQFPQDQLKEVFARSVF